MLIGAGIFSCLLAADIPDGAPNMGGEPPQAGLKGLLNELQWSRRSDGTEAELCHDRPLNALGHELKPLVGVEVLGHAAGEARLLGD